jgi:uncharacterized protein YuzE
LPLTHPQGKKARPDPNPCPCDPNPCSLYIHLADRPSVGSDEVNDGVVLDFDANGALVGIDVQHASQRMDITSLTVSKLPLGELLAA